MEGDCRAEAEPPLAGNIELTGTNSDATTASLATDQNREDILRSSGDLMPDDESEWTDEKHNLYLRWLEVSFAKQLYQSKRMLAQCSQKNQRGTSISEKQLIIARNTSEQIDGVMCEALSTSISVDSSPPLMSTGIYNISCTGKLRSPPPTNMPEFLNLCSVMKYGKRMIFRGLETPPEEFSFSKPSHEYLLESITEGIGQNFADEGPRKLPNFESQAKRLKTVASSDGSTQDQIKPSKN